MVQVPEPNSLHDQRIDVAKLLEACATSLREKAQSKNVSLLLHDIEEVELTGNHYDEYAHARPRRRTVHRPELGRTLDA